MAEVAAANAIVCRDYYTSSFDSAVAWVDPAAPTHVYLQPSLPMWSGVVTASTFGVVVAGGSSAAPSSVAYTVYNPARTQLAISATQGYSNSATTVVTTATIGIRSIVEVCISTGACEKLLVTAVGGTNNTSLTVVRAVLGTTAVAITMDAKMYRINTHNYVSLLDGAISARDATSITADGGAAIVAATAGPGAPVGSYSAAMHNNVYQVCSEMFVVTAVNAGAVGTSGTTLTVIRGVNGTASSGSSNSAPAWSTDELGNCADDSPFFLVKGMVYSGSTTGATATDSATSLTVQKKEHFPAGSIIKVQSETMYVTASAGTGAGTITVSRGFGGSTAAAVVNGAPIVRVAADKVKLTLASAVTQGQAVTVAHTKSNTAAQVINGGKHAEYGIFIASATAAAPGVFTGTFGDNGDDFSLLTPGGAKARIGGATCTVANAVTGVAFKDFTVASQANGSGNTSAALTMEDSTADSTAWSSAAVSAAGACQLYGFADERAVESTAAPIAVTNNVGVPKITSAVVENAANTKLVLTFSEAIAYDATTRTKPAVSIFGVTAGGNASEFALSASNLLPPFGTQIIDGATVTITLGAAQITGATSANGHVNQFVKYVAPASGIGGIGDAAGGAVASMSALIQAKNNVGRPTLVSALIADAAPTKVVLTFSVNITTGTPLPANFAVMVGNSAKTISSAALNSNKVELTADSAFSPGDAVTVAYTKSAVEANDIAAAVTTGQNGEVDSFTAFTVENAVDSSVPTLTSCHVAADDPTKIVAVFSDTYINDGGGGAVHGDWASKVAGSARTLTAFAFGPATTPLLGPTNTIGYAGAGAAANDKASNSIKLTMASAATVGQTVTLESYTQNQTANKKLQSNGGLLAAIASAVSCSNNVGKPYPKAARVLGSAPNVVQIELNSKLAAGMSPAVADWAVTVNGSAATETAVTYSPATWENAEAAGAAVIKVTVNTNITAGQTVTVAYTKGTGSDCANLESETEVEMDSFVAISATNHIGTIRPIHAVVGVHRAGMVDTSDAADHTGEITITYDFPVNTGMSGTTGNNGDWKVMGQGHSAADSDDKVTGAAFVSTADSNNQVKLTMDNSAKVTVGEVITIEYTKAAAAAKNICNGAGPDLCVATHAAFPVLNPIANFAADAAFADGQTFTSTTLGADKVKLTLSNGLSIAQGYWGTINKEDFAVTLAPTPSPAITAIALSGDGKDITLTLAADMSHLTTSVNVAYTLPSADYCQRLCDQYGQCIATDSAIPTSAATNMIGRANVVSTTVENAEPTKVVIVFDADVATGTPTAGDFAVVVAGGSSANPSSVARSPDNTLTLTLASAVTEGQSVVVTYTKSGTGGQNIGVGAHANQLWATTSPALTAVNNVGRQTVATQAIADATPTVINLTLSEAADADSSVSPGDFTVMVANAARAVTAGTVSGTSVNLTLASAVQASETVTVAYTKHSSADCAHIEESNGTELASFTAKTVTNNVVKELCSAGKARLNNATANSATCSSGAEDEASTVRCAGADCVAGDFGAASTQCCKAKATISAAGKVEMSGVVWLAGLLAATWMAKN
jgi:uncharacterized repeat protein (TIGR02059 family)